MQRSASFFLRVVILSETMPATTFTCLRIILCADKCVYGLVCALSECLSLSLIHGFTLQSTAFPAEELLQAKDEFCEKLYCHCYYCNIKQNSYLFQSIKHQVMYFIYIGNYRRKGGKRGGCSLRDCFFVLCVCLWCADGPYITSSLQCFPVSHLHVITALFYK